MSESEIQTKIAKAVQQKELGNQCVAKDELPKALYHYHYGVCLVFTNRSMLKATTLALNFANGLKESGASTQQKELIEALLAS